MQTLNNAELAFLSVLAYNELTQKVLRLTVEGHRLWTENFQPHLCVMWKEYMRLLKKHRREYGLSPSRDIVTSELADAVQGAKLPDELSAKCDSILQKLLSGDIPTLDDGTKLVSEAVKREAGRSIMSKLATSNDIDELRRMLDASSRDVASIEKKAEDRKGKLLFNPLMEIESLANRVVRIPTGINWMDEVSSGGGRAGELWLVLGPSGGGKTTITVQWACAQALLGNSTLWATYEQSLQGDIAERMVSYITDTSLDQIRDRGFKMLAQDVQDKYWASVSGVGDKLKALDMTLMEPDPSNPDDNGGIYSIARHLREIKAGGAKVDIVLIDWFGAMMSRIATLTGKSLENCYRFLAQEEINKAIQLARQEDVMIAFFHQTDMKTQHMRPTYCPDMTCAKDMHDLCNFFDLVFTLGRRDANDVCYFSGAKTRKGQSVTKTLKLIGDKARFVAADGWLPNRDGNFYKPDEMSGGGEPAGYSGYSREIE